MENNLIQFEDENVLMRFLMGKQEYVVLCENENVQEGDDIYFAKLDITDDGIPIVRNIEDDKEYDEVIKYYEKILNEVGEDDEEDEL